MFWGAKKNLKKFFKNILAIEKLHKIAFIIFFFFFFLKKFEKVEKTGFFRAKFFFHCTLSVILGPCPLMRPKQSLEINFQH
jgi:hypothetical protein